MNRNQMIDFVNEQICPIFSNGNVSDTVFWSFSPIETLKLVEKWRKENGYPKEMKAEVTNGFLYINKKPVGRIALREPMYINGEAYEFDWEGYCINDCED